MSSINPNKPLAVWHGDYMGDQRNLTEQNFKFSDRNAMSLVASKQREIKQAGGGCVVSRKFGMGPAMIVLTIPTNVQPVRFFDQADVSFRLIATIGEAPKAVDKAIKEVVKKPVSGEGSVDQAAVEAQSDKIGKSQSSEEG